MPSGNWATTSMAALSSCPRRWRSNWAIGESSQDAVSGALRRQTFNTPGRCRNGGAARGSSVDSTLLELGAGVGERLRRAFEGPTHRVEMREAHDLEEPVRKV